MNNPQCDNCNRFFEINLKTTKRKDGIHRVWFKCPHCKATYTAYYTDKDIRKLQADQRRITREITNIRLSTSDDKETAIAEKMKVFEQNKRDMQKMMEELRGRVESGSDHNC